jgi:hypothetical protein
VNELRGTRFFVPMRGALEEESGEEGVGATASRPSP